MNVGSQVKEWKPTGSQVKCTSEEEKMHCVQCCGGSRKVRKKNWSLSLASWRALDLMGAV